MALIENTLFGVEDKVANSIEALRTFEPKEGYFVAFSGGKDSVVVKKLCDLAGVKYDAHYSVTSVDPPELVQFIKKSYSDVSFDIPHYDDGKPITMWNLIPKVGMPPTRLMRYCCERLKETSGYGRLVVTGVRWAESTRRANKKSFIEIGGEKSGLNIKYLNNDNGEARQLVESCYRKKKTVLNPIINWEDEDVWEFIHKYEVPYCKLYDEGFKRLGCLGCPMSTAAAAELERYPKYKEAYLRTFGRMLKVRREREREYLGYGRGCYGLVAV
jgi:phosphoadenosine phosphosulfate reductase